MATRVLDAKMERALQLVGGKIDPDIENFYESLEERVLAQALENVEKAEHRLREVQLLLASSSFDW